jgi:acyl-CoA synthetase (AMP-forming)/AMP-acid ligase II/acyl carrier protein
MRPLTNAKHIPAARPDAGQQPSTIAEVLAASIGEHAGREAILSPGRPALTFDRLGLQIEATARALAEAGYGRGSRIAVALPDGPEFAVAVLAVSCAATCAPLSDRLDAQSLAELLRAMRADALIVREGNVSEAERAAERAGLDVIRLRSSAGAPAGSFELAFERRRTPVAIEPALPGDVALVAHTSGTTSTPKIVPFEQWRIAWATRNRSALGHLEGTDRVLLLMPLYSMGAIRRSLLLPLASGCSVICPTAVDGRALVDILDAYAPTQCIASPVTLIAMREEFERRIPRPRHSLRLLRSSNAELRPADRESLERTFGVPVTQVYGMTETGLIAQTPLPPTPSASGSVGRPPQGVQITIADPEGVMLETDQIGEVLVRGPEVFAGYENDPDANRAAFRDGWFRTGDSGRIDPQGMLHLVGRIKDIINRGGVKIAPREIEGVLLQHQAVREAAAFAVPHRTLGEDVAAAVVLHEGATASESELRQFVRRRLPASRVPGRILTVDRMPRGALEKVSRTELALLAGRTAPPAQEPPRGRDEERIAAIFAEVLELAEVGRQDGFFECGGDSLRGVRVLARVEELFGVSAPLDLLIDHPRVAEFAVAIRALASTDPRRRSEAF